MSNYDIKDKNLKIRNKISPEETQEENSSYYRKQYQATADELAILKEQESEKAHE